ncbi:MAG: aspartate aminotransferase family protein [Alphaproteobacteria bacterium]
MEGAREIIQATQQHIVHPLHFTKDNEQPLVVVEGRGEMLRDASGKEYIDGLSGLWNVNAGHGRKELGDIAAEQMAKLGFASAYSGATNPPAAKLAEKLVSVAYGNTTAVYFTTAGAESNESAFKMARFYWKLHGKPNKVKVFSRVHAYHGLTMAAMSATGMSVFHKMFGPLVPNFHQTAAPYQYRWPGNGDAGIGAVEALDAAIQKEGADTVAAVIAEPVMGAGGVIVPPASYFPKLRALCDKHDILLITDEVITGFGRTGRWFAAGHWGVEPDLTTFAKGVTSAYLPLGGVLVSKRVHQALKDAPADQKFMHAATYSGHPVCCAVGLRNVEIIEKEKLVDRAATVGKKLLAGLETLRDIPAVGDVRGLGMMCGVELVESKDTKKPAIGLGPKFTKEAMSRGLLTRVRAGSADPAIGDTICVAPPLMTPESSIDRIVSIIRDSLVAATK